MISPDILGKYYLGYRNPWKGQRWAIVIRFPATLGAGCRHAGCYSGPVSELLGRASRIVTLHTAPRRASFLLRPTRLLVDGGKHPSLWIMGSFIVPPKEADMRFRAPSSTGKSCEDEISPGGGSLAEFAKEPRFNKRSKIWWLKKERMMKCWKLGVLGESYA